MERFRVLPVLKMEGGFVIAFTQDSPAEGKRVLEEKWVYKLFRYIPPEPPWTKDSPYFMEKGMIATAVELYAGFMGVK